MAISPLDRIFAGTQGTQRHTNGYCYGDLFAGSYKSGVFRSSDDGDDWIQVSDGLIVRFVLSFMTSSSGNIFAGDILWRRGFRSTDKSDNWTAVNTGLDCGNI
jgi:hypothetical protein